MAKYSIGLDLGGTNYRAAAIDCDGKLIDRVSGSTNSAAGRDAIVDSIVGAIVTLRDRRGAGDLTGIGVAVPGFILIEKGLSAPL